MYPVLRALRISLSYCRRCHPVVSTITVKYWIWGQAGFREHKMSIYYKAQPQSLPFSPPDAKPYYRLFFSD